MARAKRRRRAPQNDAGAPAVDRAPLPYGVDVEPASERRMERARRPQRDRRTRHDSPRPLAVASSPARSPRAALMSACATSFISSGGAPIVVASLDLSTTGVGSMITGGGVAGAATGSTARSSKLSRPSQSAG